MKIIFSFCIITACFLSFEACSSSDQAAKGNATEIIRSSSKPVQQENAEGLIIRRGDRIKVDVWGYPEFNFTDSVKESGLIMIPLLGEMTVAGTTKEQFISDLTQKLSEYIQGEIKLVVTLTSTGVKEITVLGSVVRQENYPLPTEMSLMNAMALAGGTLPDADLRHVRILRGGPNRQPIEVDVLSFVEHGNIDAVPIIKAGDTIFVPKEEDIVRELSLYLGSAVFLFGFFVLFK